MSRKPEYKKWYLIKRIFSERCREQDNWLVGWFKRWRITISCAWAVLRDNKLDQKFKSDEYGRSDIWDYKCNAIEVAVLWATSGSHPEYGSTQSWESIWYPYKKTNDYNNQYFIESDGFP